MAPTASRTTAFSLRILGELSAREAGRNVWVSPLSLSIALGMAAAGTTERELLGGLMFESRGELLGELSALLRETPNSEDLSLTLANSIFLPEKSEVHMAFQELVRAQFGAEVDSKGLSAERVNAWVKAATKGLIGSILSDDDLGPGSLAVLLNAVYFKGEWIEAFKEHSTVTCPFTTEGRGAVKASMMKNGAMHVGYFADKGGSRAPDKGLEGIAKASEGEPQGMQAIAMPYKFQQEPGRYQMLVVLPPVGQSLASFVAELSPERLGEIDGRLRKAESVQVSVPKMKFAYEYGPGIHKLLQEMGVKAPFDASTEWQELTPGEAFISAIKHKAVLEFDEAGTRAAAVTAVVMMKNCMPKLGPTFSANRPFVMALYDRKLGVPLFVGAIHDPSKKK